MRIYSLDAARGFAAISVVLFHLYSGITGFRHLFLFVDFFFVLSGFVLAPSIAELSSFEKNRKFLWNRFVRLFPMAYSALLFVIGIQLTVELKYRIAGEDLSESIPLDLATLLASFLLLQVFSAKSQLLLYPLWSLSSEWLTNLFSSSIFFLSMIKKVILFVLLGSILIGISLAIESYPNLQNCANQVGRGFLGFGLGILSFEYRKVWNTRSNSISLIIIAISSPLFAFYVNSKSFAIAMYLSPLMFTISVLSLYKLETQMCIRPPIPICRYLGRISYGVYVWHVVATNMLSLISKNFGLQIFQPLELFGIPRLLLVLCITIACTEIVLKFVEAPIRRKMTYV
jgi:peptidoglycan/LPS O-acetylase OafA/YrhL